MAIWTPDVDSAEEFYAEFEKQMERDHESHKEIVDEINSCLKAGTNEAFERIGEIVESHEFMRLAGLFNDIKGFRTSYAIYTTERDSRILDSIYSITESIEDYLAMQLTALYCFRRIQMRCEEAEIEDLFSKLMERHVSIFFIIQTINEAKLGDKGYIGQAIAKLFSQYRREADAQIIKSYSDRKYPDIKSSFMIEVAGELRSYKPQKICFITCVNNRQMYEECLFYLKRLIIPAGIEIDSISIEEADSMTSGYNAAMDASDANIKIYLHQDVCIIDPFFLFRVLDTLESDQNIGVVGIVGSVKLPEDAVMWHGPRVGKLYVENTRVEFRYNSNAKSTYESVEAVDGLLIATSKDVPWREDLFDGWDFYDASACAEFCKRGFKVVVPDQTTPWVIHDDGMVNLYSYGKYRKIFIDNYL